MNRYLTPLTSETLYPVLVVALKACRREKPRGTREEMLRNLLVTTQERNHIFQAETPYIAIAERLAVNRVLDRTFRQLEEFDSDLAQILRLYYTDMLSDDEIAAHLNYARSSVQRYRNKKGISKLTEVLLQIERRAREEWIATLQDSLPAPRYTAFFGREEQTAQLIKKLVDPHGPKIAAITGMGGLGKTALAHFTAKKLVETFHFDTVVWLTIERTSDLEQAPPPRQLIARLIRSLANQLKIDNPTALDNAQCRQVVRQRLRDIPSLIIIDNLEIHTDTVFLHQQFQTLAGNSRFLITSRTRPPSQVTFTLSLSPLERKTARQMLQSYAQARSTHGMSRTREQSIDEALDIVGGHPLALKLVADLALKRKLSKIFSDFKTGSIDMTNDTELYDHIYAQKWQQLTDPSQRVLLALALVGLAGVDEEQLMHFAGYSAEERIFWLGFDPLISFSLIEISYDHDNEIYYSIHPLTQAFLIRIGRTEQYAHIFQEIYLNGLRYWHANIPQLQINAYFLKHHAQVVQTIDLALDIPEGQADSAELLLQLFAMYVSNRVWERWLTVLIKSVEQDQASADEVKTYVLIRAATLLSDGHNQVKADHYYQRAESIAKNTLDDTKLLSMVYAGRAWLLYRQHQYEQAYQLAKTSLTMRQSLKLNAKYFVSPLNVMGLSQWAMGHRDAAITRFTTMLRCTEQVGDTHSTIMACGHLVLAYGRSGEMEQALHHFDKALDIIQDHSANTFIPEVYNYLAQAYLESNQLDEAFEILQRGHEAITDIPVTQREQLMTTYLYGRYYFQKGQYHTAQSTLEQCIMGWSKLDDALYLADARLMLGVTLQQLNRDNKAQPIIHTAWQTLDQYQFAYRVQQLKALYN